MRLFKINRNSMRKYLYIDENKLNEIVYVKN